MVQNPARYAQPENQITLYITQCITIVTGMEVWHNSMIETLNIYKENPTIHRFDLFTGFTLTNKRTLYNT